MKLFRWVHTAYGFAVFSLLFVFFLPLLFVPIAFPRYYNLVGVFNRWWAKLMFIFCFLPYRVETRAKLDSHRQYIFCPNHFSYLDIPTMGLNPINTIFVGKNDIEKIPFFGFMYRKLHITVDRTRMRSRWETMLASMKAIDAGKSLVIYPEGGMMTKHPPLMTPFKDGAFRTAIEKQIPIVPVTIPYNWIILPDQKKIRLHAGNVKVIFHAPIETKDMTLDDLPLLKNQVFSVIQSELLKSNSNKIASKMPFAEQSDNA